jgi:hypothetical protein
LSNCDAVGEAGIHPIFTMSAVEITLVASRNQTAVLGHPLSWLDVAVELMPKAMAKSDFV